MTFIFVAMIMACLAALIVCTLFIKVTDIDPSPTSIIITNTTIHVCSSATNCTTFTTFENAAQQACAILSQARVFAWYDKIKTQGHSLVDECRV